MQARFTVLPRFPWLRPLIRAMVVGLTVGVAIWFALAQHAPERIARAVAHLRQQSVAQRTAPVPHDSAALPDAMAAMFQQFDTATTSYQAQPVDLQSGLRLIIPKIGVNVPVVERGLVKGWMVVAPGENVTHFTFSAYPGAVGNSIMYSHDGTAFRHLDSLAVGDTIMVQTPHGAEAFRVRELRIIPPTMLSILDATQTPTLTLLTCYPYGVDSSRLAVIADPAQP